MRNCPKDMMKTALFSQLREHSGEFAVDLAKQLVPVDPGSGLNRTYHGCRASMMSAASWNTAQTTNWAITGNQIPVDMRRSGGRREVRRLAGRVKPMVPANTVVYNKSCRRKEEIS